MRLLHGLRQSFLVGLVAILPIYITVWVAVAVFNYVDRVMAPQFDDLIGFHVPGLGVVTTLVAITLAGVLARFVVVRRLGHSLEAFVESVPFLRTVYGAVKQVLLPLVGGGEAKAFKRVVAFEWPGDDLWVVGFLVQERQVGEAPGPDDEVLVFLPTNHLHLGFVIATRRRKLRVLDMSIEDAIRTQFSLGVAAPPVQLAGPARLADIAGKAEIR